MQDSAKYKAFSEKFMIDQLVLLDDGKWILSVRPGQLTLGSMVISSAHGISDFSGIPADSGPGLILMIAKAEELARSLFGAIRINVVCLMMQDPIVHFHIIPRYDQPVERYGQVWVDEDWPAPPTFRPLVTQSRMLKDIKSGITDWLVQSPARTGNE